MLESICWNLDLLVQLLVNIYSLNLLICQGNIITLNLPFSSSPEYNLDSGSGFRTFTQTLSYTPTQPSLFLNPNVFLGIHEFEFVSNRDIALSWNIVPQPGNKLDVNISTWRDARITRLKGLLLIIADTNSDGKHSLAN